MSLLVDDSVPQWVFSNSKSAGLSRKEAGWHQLADDPLSDTNDYYNSTSLWTMQPGAVASLVFQGTDIYLYSAKSPQGGEMNVTCDWDTRLVQLNASELLLGEMVWQATNLDSTKLHAVRVEMVEGGRINIDYVGINPGPFSAIPPSVASPLPPAFSGIHALDGVSLAITSQALTTATRTVTMTMAMTMTMTASSTASIVSSSGVFLSKAAVAGIIIGLAAGIALAVMLILRCFRRRRRSMSDEDAHSRSLGRRNLHLPRWIRRRGYSSSQNSEPSFIQIEGDENVDDGMLEIGQGVASFSSTDKLPSIHRLSSFSIGQSAVFSAPTPTRSVLAQYSQPSSKQGALSSRKHLRKHSLAVTLSINTDINAIREGAFGNIGRRPSLAHDQTIGFAQTGHQISDGFSTSDLSEEWQEVAFEKNLLGDDPEVDDARFYAEHFSTSSTNAYTEGHNNDFVDDHIEEPDDIAPDTPLISHSPAVASSKLSLSRHNSGRSRLSRFSKGNKILRSLHSHSSKSSSSRHSVGKLSRLSSRRHSALSTPIARTPVSKNSMSTTASDSPRSERRNGRLSTLSGLSVPVMVPEELENLVNTPPLPKVPENFQDSQPLHPPSAWMGPITLPPQILPSQLPRTHRLAGPRARNGSSASASYLSGSLHIREPSQNERPEMLSMVEEMSRAASEQASIEDNHSLETSGLLHEL